MEITTTITGFVALYIFLLAAFAGYEIIGRVPAILHTPLMSGSNFVHGIVVVGAMWALLNAGTTLEQVIGFVVCLLVFIGTVCTPLGVGLFFQLLQAHDFEHPDPSRCEGSTS